MNELINDEKHYVTINNYLKSLYHKKVFKVALSSLKVYKPIRLYD